MADGNTLLFLDDPMPSEEANESLDERIRRLENAIVALADTSLIEARVAERVKTDMEPQLRSLPVKGVLLDASTRSLPPGTNGTNNAEPNNAMPNMHTMIGMAAPYLNNLNKTLNPSSWFIVEIMLDVRDVFAMYFDSRYRKTVTFQMLMPMLLGAFIMSQLLLSTLIGKGVDIVLLLIGFKLFSREIHRYRELIRPLDQPPHN